MTVADSSLVTLQCSYNIHAPLGRYKEHHESTTASAGHFASESPRFYCGFVDFVYMRIGDCFCGSLLAIPSLTHRFYNAAKVAFEQALFHDQCLVLYGMHCFDCICCTGCHVVALVSDNFCRLSGNARIEQTE